jgi:hypothetical protein
MLQSILNTLFGCSHSRTTFPLTPGRKTGFPAPGATRNGTYVVCLDCGKEFAYDWREMRVGQVVVTQVPATEVQPRVSVVIGQTAKV